MSHVALIATLDTKGEEAAFLVRELRHYGISVVVVDAGVGEPVHLKPDVAADEVYRAGGGDRATLAQRGDRGQAIDCAMRGVASWIATAYAQGQIAGVLGIGGSAGTTLGTNAMRGLPVGVPKLMVSTMAAGDVRGFVGARDIAMMYSVVDLAGVNRVSARILSNAARAMAGMVSLAAPPHAGPPQRPLVAATMFGVTTPCVQRAKEVLEHAGYEVLVFHATGSGGAAMEGLIRDGLFAGVLDLTTTELADLHVGGVMSAGPERLTAAAECGVPQVVSLGATDMVNFWAYDTVPAEFRHRNLYRHNQNVTLMRTTPTECDAIAADLAQKVRRSQAGYHVVAPALGVSAIDQAGQPFDDPAARRALMERLRQALPADHLTVAERHLNDPAFATLAAERLITLMRAHRSVKGATTSHG